MSFDLIIRNPRNADAPALTVLLQELGYPQDRAFIVRKMEEFSATPDAKIFVAEVDGNVVGFLSFDSHTAFHREGKIGIITAMCILESMRGNGIGQRLIENAERVAKESGCVKMAIASGIQRTETHEFYRAKGYEEKEKRFVKEL